MAKVLAIVPDLMLGSKVEAMLRAAGHEVEWVHATPDSTEADLVVADLHAVETAEVVALGPPVLGFYAHTDTEIKGSADAAGIELAVPRSRMVRELPELVERLLRP